MVFHVRDMVRARRRNPERSEGSFPRSAVVGRFQSDDQMVWPRHSEAASAGEESLGIEQPREQHLALQNERCWSADGIVASAVPCGTSYRFPGSYPAVPFDKLMAGSARLFSCALPGL